MDQFDFIETVTEIFKKNNLEVFIDCGTLLGIVRDGKILPWDNDLDFAVFEKHLNDKIINTLCNDFEELGFKFYFKKNHIHIFHASGVYADVNIFKLVSENYISENYYPANMFDKFLYLIYESINFNYPDKSPSKNILKYFIHQIIIRLFSNTKEKPICRFLTNYIERRMSLHWLDLSLSIPHGYLSAFKLLNHKYLVPSSTDEYLKFKYGQGWKIPDSNWHWSKDLSLKINQKT